MKTLLDLLIVLFFYIFLSASSLGWGQRLGRLLGLRAKGDGLQFADVWLGWCGIILLLQLVHCVFPLNIYPCLAIYGVGLVLLIRAYFMRSITIPWSDWAELKGIGQTGLLLFAIWVALQAMKSPVDFDDGLYHLASIRWLNEYAIVPGLGNLHGRLAFNYAYYPFAASLNLYPWFNHGHNVAIGWLALVMTAECLFYFNRVVRAMFKRTEPLIEDVVPAVLLPYLLYAIGQMDLASSQVDHIVFLMRVILFILLWRNLASSQITERLKSARLCIILGATAVTLKLSILFFPFTACLITAIRCYQDRSWELRLVAVDLWKPALFAVLILGVWMGRGIITSGYPVYPLTFLSVHTDWTIPKSVVVDMQTWIYSWGRWPFNTPDVVLKDWSWLVPWTVDILVHEKVTVIIPLEIFLAVLPAITALLVLNLIHRKPISPLYLGVLPILASLISWFLSAPAPRFADGLFWLSPLAVLAACIMSQFSLPRRQLGTVLLFGLMCLPLLSQVNELPGPHFAFPSNGWEPIRKVTLKEMVTDKGLKIYIPATGYQCWDAPLPNGPFFYPNLQLRGQGLQSGFKSSLGLLNGGTAPTIAKDTGHF